MEPAATEVDGARRRCRPSRSVAGLVAGLALVTGCTTVTGGGGSLEDSGTTVPWTLAPSTTVVPTTAPTTTAPPTTAPPSTESPSTTTDDGGAVPEPDGDSLPRTGPSEAAVLAAVGFGLVLAGRLALDGLAVIDRRRLPAVNPRRTDIPR